MNGVTPSRSTAPACGRSRADRTICPGLEGTDTSGLCWRASRDPTESLQARAPSLRKPTPAPSVQSPPERRLRSAVRFDPLQNQGRCSPATNQACLHPDPRVPNASLLLIADPQVVHSSRADLVPFCLAPRVAARSREVRDVPGAARAAGPHPEGEWRGNATTGSTNLRGQGPTARGRDGTRSHLRVA